MANKELKYINSWTELYDELDELKKIFFEFLKRWTERDRHLAEPNKQILYEKHSQAVFTLNSHRRRNDSRRRLDIIAEDSSELLRPGQFTINQDSEDEEETF